MMRPGTMFVAMLMMLTAGATAHAKMEMRTFPVLAGAGAHDVYPAPDGAVWFTAQSAGKLGRLDPRTGKSDLIALGPGAAPHGVIVGPDGAAWVTEGGQNAIARGWIPRPAPSQQLFVNRKNPQIRFACTLARTFVLHRELSFACCLRVGVLGRDGSVS
jgi:hypothetical protein